MPPREIETMTAPRAPLDEALLDPKGPKARPGESLGGQPAEPGGSVGGSLGGSLGAGPGLESVKRIPVLLQVVLGSASMPVSSLLKLNRGAIVPLDHRVGEPVDVVVNGRVIARGEVMIVEDDNSRFGVSLTEIVGPNGSDAA